MTARHYIAAVVVALGIAGCGSDTPLTASSTCNEWKGASTSAQETFFTGGWSGRPADYQKFLDTSRGLITSWCNYEPGSAHIGDAGTGK
jgi:hypothetical protein